MGLVANVAASVHAQKLPMHPIQHPRSSLPTAQRPPLNHFYQIKQSAQEVQLSISILSAQSFCEVAVLLLIVAAFVVAGVVCARVIRSLLIEVDATSAPAAVGRELIKHVVVTTAVVFVAFVVRSVQSTMFAVARQLQDGARRCPGVTSVCDSSCHSVFTHMHRWAVNTPEFQVTVVLVSSPLTLLVALWGMTSRRTLQAMRSKEQDISLTERVSSRRR